MKKIFLMCAVSVFMLGIFAPAKAAKNASKSKADLNKALVSSIENRDLKQAAALVKQGADANIEIVEGLKPIHYAAAMGDIEFIKLLLTKGADVNAKSDRGITSIIAAIEGQGDNSGETLKFLISKGADVNAAEKDDTGGKVISIYPINLVSGYYNDFDLVKLLVDNGANVNVKTELGQTPLHNAAYKNNPKTIQYLIEKGADVYAKDIYGMTPIHTAIDSTSYQITEEEKAKTLETLKVLASKIEDIDMKGRTFSPMIVAASRGDKEIIDFLLSKGSDLNLEDKIFTTPIEHAQSKETAHYLIDKGAKVNLKTAILLDDLKMVEDLVKNGADINKQPLYIGLSPLHYAIIKNNTKIAKYLVEKGAYIKALNYSNENALDIAVGHENKELTKFLIKKGGDVSKALRYAQNKEFAEMLVKNGANVNAVSTLKYNYYTPLHKAVTSNNKELVEYLLEKGADANIKDSDGETPFNIAAFLGYKDLSELLIKNGAEVNTIDNKGQTPLMRSDKVEESELLIKQGAYINEQDNEGKTALHINMSRYIKADLLELLVSNGADINAKDNYGKTPLDYAQTDNIKELLIQKGAKSGKDLK